MATSSITIVQGTRWYYLRVNGMFVQHGFKSGTGQIKAIKSEGEIPYGATEWVSIAAIRNFWHKFMQEVIASTLKPYRSFKGALELIIE